MMATMVALLLGAVPGQAAEELRLESINTLYSATLRPAEGVATSAQVHIVGPGGSLHFPLADAVLPKGALLLDDGDLLVLGSAQMALYDHGTDGALRWSQPLPSGLGTDMLVWTRQDDALLLRQADGAGWLAVALSSGAVQPTTPDHTAIPEAMLAAAAAAAPREAFELTTSALRLDGSLVGGWIRLVRLLQAQGRHEPALSSTARARSLNPAPAVTSPDWLAYRQLYLLAATSEQALGSLLGAEQVLRDGLGLAPDDAALTFALARLMLETGRDAAAWELLAAWVDRDVQRLIQAGDLYAGQHQWGAAARLYREAWQVARDPLLASLLADALRADGNLSGALGVRRSQLRQWREQRDSAEFIAATEEDIQRLELALRGERLSTVR